LEAVFFMLIDLWGKEAMKRSQFYLDLLERASWTFIQAALAFFIVTQDVNWRVVATAGGIAVAKSLVAVNLPWTASDSASILPADVDPPQ
jgi:Mrp family chromosome partitioning ATPase